MSGRRRTLPDPVREIRILTLQSLRGASVWSRRPVTRMDLAIGAYEDISSADIPGFISSLVHTLPGLAEHQCSVGKRGGFVDRLRRGTYVPHIVEHVALELQETIGHHVAYGKTRGSGRPGEYTLAFEHDHGPVGMRAAGLALDLVQRAIAGTLDGVEAARGELAMLAATPDEPALRLSVLCGITGSGDRRATRDALLGRGLAETAPIVDVAPGYLLQAGLPYSRSAFAIVVDTALTDVPERFRVRQRAESLVGVLADAVAPGGFLICPARATRVRALAREAGLAIGVFSTRGGIGRRARDGAELVATLRRGRIAVERDGTSDERTPLDDGAPVAAQLAAALAVCMVQRPPT